MKKSTRILSILMAFAMLIGSFSVMGSAYQAYKGPAIEGQYNDVDSPDFTLEQYASMGLDEVDRMLAKEKLVLNIYVGTVDLSSVNTALTSVQSLLSSLGSLLPMLGDAANLNISRITGVQRHSQTDVEVIYSLLNLLADNSGLVEKYVNGSISLGVMDSFIADYKFDVRNLAIGMLYSLTKQGTADQYSFFDDGIAPVPAEYTNNSNGALTILQQLLNENILGEWVLLDDLFADVYDWVDYEDYAFAEKYNETAPNTAAYDYYGWVHPKEWVTASLGDSVRVAQGAAAPAASYKAVDVTTDANGYEFIEYLMQHAYNNLAVPVLNDQTRPWLRQLCGITYDSRANRTIYNAETKLWENNPDYDPNYDGELLSPDDATEYAKIFNVNAVVPKVTIPADTTFVDYFNNILGQFLDNVLVVSRGVETADGLSWTWVDGGNEHLFDNICTVGKFVIQVSGDLFFGESVKVPTSEELSVMNNQQVVSFVLKAILNSSVDWMYIEDEYNTVAEVGYRAVEQLAWQDIPQINYTQPARSDFATDAAYYDALVEKALDILFDVAVYNLNQGFDMVPGEGLLEYQGDNGSYENNLIQIAAWAVSKYGSILALDLRCDDTNGLADGLVADDVWQDFDTIINALIPIKGGTGSNPWISAEIAGDGTEIVSKAFIFDYVLKPLYYLDSTNLATIFERNPAGAFASDNGVKIIISILENVFELIAPGVFRSQETIDQILQNNLLGNMANDLIKALGTESFVSGGVTKQGRGVQLVAVALPIVCLVLGLSDDQEFEEMDIYLPQVVSQDATTIKFEVYNGSSGINTGYTNAAGDFTQDDLYTYRITSATANVFNPSGASAGVMTYTGLNAGTTIAGGDKADVALNGSISAGQLIEFTVNYEVLGEDGNAITTALSKTVYSYVGNTDKDDDAIEVVEAMDDRQVKYEASIYLSTSEALDAIKNYSIRIDDNEGEVVASASVTGVSNASSSYPFVALNGDAAQTTASLAGTNGLYFLNPFAVATKNGTDYYERFAYNYQKDENGNTLYDDNGDPIKVTEAPFDNGGVPDGQYNVSTTLNVAGTTKTINTYIHLYDDFGLVSAFERAVSANRQKSNYDTTINDGAAEGLWSNYQTALKNAASLALKPKAGATFAADIVASSSDYTNKFEELALALEVAIAALEPYEKAAGVSSLRSAVAEISGYNFTVTEGADGPYKTDLEYDDANYVYFGMRDYVPHTYNRYKDARSRADGIINSQYFYVPAPFEAGYTPTDAELAAYNDAVLAYQENVANMRVVGAIEAVYAEHMVDLTGSRLIRIPADTSKLAIVMDLCITKADIGDASQYTEKSYTAYQKAVAFAQTVAATPIMANGQPNLRPSQVNKATSELVSSWKKLAISADYSALDAAIVSASAIIEAAGAPETQTTYTAETYAPFYAAYTEAVNVDRNLSKTDSNTSYLGSLTTALTSTQVALALAASGEAVFEFSTEDQYLYYDATYAYSFVPYPSTNETDYYMPMLEDGTMIDAYILGVGFNMVEDDIRAMFSVLDNVTVEVSPYNSSYSTGTLVQLFNESTGELIKTYHVVLRGDIDGNSAVEVSDINIVGECVAYLHEFAWDGYEQFKAVAGDVNGDFSIDVADSDTINGSVSYLFAIDQETGEKLPL